MCLPSLKTPSGFLFFQFYFTAGVIETTRKIPLLSNRRTVDAFDRFSEDVLPMRREEQPVPVGRILQGDEEEGGKPTVEDYAQDLTTVHTLCRKPCQGKTGLQPIDSQPAECFRYCDCSKYPGIGGLVSIKRFKMGTYKSYFDLRQNKERPLSKKLQKEHYIKDYQCNDKDGTQGRLKSFDEHLPDTFFENQLGRFTNWKLLPNVFPLIIGIYACMVVITVLAVFIYSRARGNLPSSFRQKHEEKDKNEKDKNEKTKEKEKLKEKEKTKEKTKETKEAKEEKNLQNGRTTSTPEQAPLDQPLLTPSEK